MTTSEDELFAEARRLFHAELKERQLAYRVEPDGTYLIRLGDRGQCTASVSEMYRDYASGPDAGVVKEFAQLILAAGQQVPAWNEAQSCVRWQLTPGAPDIADTETLCEAVTPLLTRTYVYASPDGTQITDLKVATLESWGVDRDAVAEMARANMRQLMETATLQNKDLGGFGVGMFVTEHEAFKASLTLAEGLRELVEERYGWPVVAVMPTRDFVYILDRASMPFLDRLAKVVVSEFLIGGYSVSVEVFEFSDDGVRAIGSFGEA